MLVDDQIRTETEDSILDKWSRTINSIPLDDIVAGMYRVVDFESQKEREASKPREEPSGRGEKPIDQQALVMGIRSDMGER